jgi:hypothetical protein
MEKIVIKSKVIERKRSTARILKLLETRVFILCLRKILNRMTIETNKAAMS